MKSPQQNLLFVVNPISGNSQKDAFTSALPNLSIKQAFSYEVFYTTGKNDLQKLNEKIGLYKPNVVVAVGGDGTVNLVAQAVKFTSRILGIIPFGSANGMATELDMPMNPTSALLAILKGQPQAFDMLLFNDKHWGLRMGDMGFNARMIQRFEREQRRGYLGYVRSFFQEILNSSRVRYYIKGQGIDYRKKAFMLVMANATKYGSGAVINPDGQLNDGLLEICVFKQLTLGSILALSWQLFFGSLKGSPHVKVFQLAEAHIQAKKPQTLQIDGEIIGQFKHLHVRVVPACLHILVPDTA